MKKSTEPAEVFQRIQFLIEASRQSLQNALVDCKNAGGIKKVSYVRYLSAQYYLTKDVQIPLLKVAASSRLARNRRLREFLFKFALEEEPHYAIALKDLEALGETLLPCPPDVFFWWSYFNSTIDAQPLQRLGATCILENVGTGIGDLVKDLITTSSFLKPSNSRFMLIHLHEELPHGTQIMNALRIAELDSRDTEELQRGAEIAALIFLRLTNWYFNKDEIQNFLSIS